MRRKTVLGEAFMTSAALFVLMALAFVGSLMEEPLVRAITVGAAAICGCACFLYYLHWKNSAVRKAAKILEKETVFDKYINSTSIPTAILDASGRVYWRNPAFAVLVGVNCEGANAYKLLPDLEKPDKSKCMEIGHVVYKKEITPIHFEKDDFLLLRLIDEKKTVKTVNANRAMLPVMCFIEIDNYNGMTAGMPLAEISEINAQIDGLVSSFAEELQGMIIKYTGYKYLVCFENKYLRIAKENRFDLLDKVRQIETSAGLNPTLSIAVGAGKNPQQSGVFAEKAMELAIGRGGDQAVVKDAEGYAFYGGIQHAVEVKSRVRSRTVSKALRNLMEQCEDVYIMGHEVPDMDCLGAALGLVACTRVLDKPTYIILDRPNAAIASLLEEMKKVPDYREMIVTPARAHLMMSSRSMLVVVDTQIAGHTIAPSLFELTDTVVVIDHHLKGTDCIEGAVLFYHEPYASSTAEMVTEIDQYFSERVKLKRLEAEALMAGSTIDTQGFSFKTGVRTFEAASYLRRVGANTTSIRHLFQDDMETYLARAGVVKNAEVRDGVAIAVCPRDSKNPQLLAAQAADSLIGIQGIGASFVLAETGQSVNISGRSFGVINVQMILEKMGGGGHATIAGAQIRGKSVAEIQAELWKNIREYMDNHEEELKRH